MHACKDTRWPPCFGRMRRRRTSSDPLTELVVIFLDLPWWGPSSVPSLPMLLGLLVVATSGGEIGGAFTAGVMRVLGPLLAALIVLAGVVGALYR